MGTKRKLVWDGEWIRIQCLVNQTFVPENPSCEWCGRATCSTVWFSIRTRRIRCLKCFEPPSWNGRIVPAPKRPWLEPIP